jgi:hypothetical protein
MIDPERKALLSLFEELSDSCPELRFGQLIANLTMMARGDSEGPSGTLRMRSWWRQPENIWRTGASGTSRAVEPPRGRGAG